MDRSTGVSPSVEGGVSTGPSPASTSAATSVTTRPTSRPTGRGGRGGRAAPRAAALHEPVPRRRRRTSSTARGAGAGARPSTRSSRRRPSWPSRSWWPTAPRCCWPTRPPAWSPPSTPAAPACRRASSAATVARMRGLGARDHRGRRSARRSAAAATRCRRRCAPTRPRVSPGVRDGLLDGHAGHRRRGGRGRPAARRMTLPVHWVPGCTRESPGPVLLPPRPADRPLRRRRAPAARWSDA